MTGRPSWYDGRHLPKFSWPRRGQFPTGRVPAGANQVPQLSFFSASEDVVDNNLSLRILKH